MAAREPRKLSQDPSKFRTLEVEWLQPDDEAGVTEGDLMVAYYTHQAALAVRRSLAERGLTQRELAQRLAVKDETLGRKLRGEAWASLRDVLTWARELGIDMLPAPESREELAARVFECLGSSTARGTSHACSGPSISIGEGKMERGRLSPSVELPR